MQRILQDGMPIFVFFFALPLLHVLLKLTNWREALFYGAFYGASSYLLLDLWLLDYDWIAFILISGIYFYYFTVFFLAFYLIRKYLKLNFLFSYALFLLFWLILEYIKSIGWVAYTYGSLLYSHYQKVFAMQFSQNFVLQNLAYILILTPAIGLHAYKRHTKIALLLAVPLAIGILRYSFAFSTNQADQASSEYLNVALIQHNVNSWQTDTNLQAFESLIALSQQAERSGAELIIWSETAFVPDYRRNIKRDIEPLEEDIQRAQEQLAAAKTPEDTSYIQGNLDYYQDTYNEVFLSHKLREYFTSTAKAVYVIGTNDSGLPELYPGEKRWGLYNSVLVIEGGQILDTYHKKRLVPFTEESKWENVLPRLNRLLRQKGFARYSSGKTSSVLQIPLKNKSKKILRVYTMICYEDSLPLHWLHDTQQFDILLSLSNDSWSSSPIGGLQHLSSALSRAIELERYFLRATTSGQSTVIDPKGHLLKRLPANQPGILFFSLPLSN